MFGFGMPEVIIILAIVLVMFGPAKLPQLGQSLGAGLRNFKKATLEEETAKISVKETEEHGG